MQFFDVDVVFNGKGLVADSAVISSENSLQTAYLLGAQFTNQVPAGPLKHSIAISYTLNAISDPNLAVLSSLKNAVIAPLVFCVGGYSGVAFLESFSLRAQPNEPIRASVSYSCFEPLSGSFVAGAVSVSYDTLVDDLAHGWTTYVTSTGSYLSVPTYELEYDVNVEYAPVYTVGRKSPYVVNFVNETERVGLVRDEHYQIEFSGERTEVRLFDRNSESQILFTGLAILWDSEKKNNFSISLKDS